MVVLITFQEVNYGSGHLFGEKLIFIHSWRIHSKCSRARMKSEHLKDPVGSVLGHASPRFFHQQKRLQLLARVSDYCINKL